MKNVEPTKNKPYGVAAAAAKKKLPEVAPFETMEILNGIQRKREDSNEAKILNGAKM